MRNCFRKGTIGETWKQVEPDRWFDPAFQIFVNKELVTARQIYSSLGPIYNTSMKGITTADKTEKVGITLQID